MTLYISQIQITYKVNGHTAHSTTLYKAASFFALSAPKETLTGIRTQSVLLCRPLPGSYRFASNACASGRAGTPVACIRSESLYSKEGFPTLAEILLHVFYMNLLRRAAAYYIYSPAARHYFTSLRLKLTLPMRSLPRHFTLT